MRLFKKEAVRRFLPSVAALVLLVLLVACSDAGKSGSTATPTSRPQLPTPIPTVTLKTYLGTGFTISYPQDWKATAMATGVTFQDARGVNGFTLVKTPNPKGAASADTIADNNFKLYEGIMLQKSQALTTSLTVTVNGTTWVQRAATGLSTTNGQHMTMKLVYLATNYPASTPTTQCFQIVYGGPQAAFGQASAAYFMPMLQSLKFAK